jgi:hypothetical protein
MTQIWKEIKRIFFYRRYNETPRNYSFSLVLIPDEKSGIDH